ncbi:MAG: hypothetical protein WCJ55_07250 [Chloroflexales bacterium]
MIGVRLCHRPLLFPGTLTRITGFVSAETFCASAGSAASRRRSSTSAVISGSLTST